MLSLSHVFSQAYIKIAQAVSSRPVSLLYFYPIVLQRLLLFLHSYSLHILEQYLNLLVLFIYRIWYHQHILMSFRYCKTAFPHFPLKLHLT